jgi:hypothetical protein
MLDWRFEFFIIRDCLKALGLYYFLTGQASMKNLAFLKIKAQSHI